MEPETFYESLRALRARDGRFPIAAYLFVFEALDALNGADEEESAVTEAAAPSTMSPQTAEAAPDQPDAQEDAVRHVSARELLEVMRRLAIAQFGYLARTVLSGWNVQVCADWGEVVFALVGAGLIKARPEDRKEDFTQGYDFSQAFDRFDEAMIRS